MIDPKLMHYRETVLSKIRNAGEWFIYQERAKYVIDVPASIKNLERIVKEIPLTEHLPQIEKRHFEK